MELGKGKKVKIPLLSKYLATKVYLLTLLAKLTLTIVSANCSRSREYRNDENSVKAKIASCMGGSADARSP